jgi:hypothetical protein
MYFLSGNLVSIFRASLGRFDSRIFWYLLVYCMYDALICFLAADLLSFDGCEIMFYRKRCARIFSLF